MRMRMSLRTHLWTEFDREMVTTRVLLARTPEAAAGWKPHPRSWTLGQLAAHLAEIPGWAVTALTRTGWDMEPAGSPEYRPPEFSSTALLLARFDAGVERAGAAIAAVTDDALQEDWTLHSADETIFIRTRLAAYRTLVLNHLVHHRGQLTVYLRLLDVPLPPLYGPTADEG